MTKKNKIRQHSVNSNCLSESTINDFLTGKLNSREMKLVRKHIDECEFCADAIEGYKSIQLKDSLSNTVKQLNNKIDSRTSQGVYRFLSVNKRIIAYSSLAASVLILAGLFLLINNLKIQDNKIVTDNLVLKKSEQSVPAEQEAIKKTEPVVAYDSFTLDADKRIKTSPEEEILPVTGKSATESYDKSDIMEIAEQEGSIRITETEAERKTEKAAYHDTKLKEVPAARATEIAGLRAYDKGSGKKMESFTNFSEKEGKARISYSQPQETLTAQTESEQDVLDEETVRTMVDELPSFENSSFNDFREYIQKKLEYPRRAKKLGIEGEVSVRFTIDTTGRVIDAEIINSTDSVLNREALRVVNSSPVWIPGKQDGKPVRVTYVVPVIFKID
jgi:TonB family protein